jgi:hypothetical protein
MKRIIKICLSSLLLILISGCGMSYNLNIDENLGVQEVVIGLEQNTIIEQNNRTKEVQIQSILDTLDLMGELGLYNKKAIYNSLTSGVQVDRSFITIGQYNESSVLKGNLFRDFEVTENGDTTTINSHAMYVSRSNNNTTLSINSINIKVPYKVISHNADSVDTSINTYTWNMNANTKIRDINITYANTANYVAPNPVIRNISSVGFITAFIVIIIIASVAIWIILKSKNNNNL